MPKPLIRLIGILITLLALALVWRYLADQGLVTAAQLASISEQMTGLQRSPWLIPTIMGIYVIALLLVFPLTLLVVVTAVLFGPWWGLLYAAIGTLSSSAASFWVGRWMGRDAIEHYGGQRLNRLSRYMGDRSIESMAVINLLPLAPFTFTNLMAGAFDMPFGRYMLGSAIGILPGLAVVTVLGGQISTVLTAETLADAWPGIGIALLLVTALLLVVQVSRRDRG
ncbi:MAG: TVP38/TMEM64 family protein [Saccharospirillum sp.]